MEIVLDVNELISALIKDSVTRRIIKETGFEFYFPEPSLEKIEKYKDYICSKAGISEDGFFSVLSDLMKHIVVVPEKEIGKYFSEADRIMGHIDQEDVVIIATALSLEKDAIVWSDDKHFDKQDSVRILKTKDLVGYL